MNAWPFAEPEHVAVFTVRSLWEQKRPILFAYHDPDGTWQFHADREPDEEEGSIITLKEIVVLDETVKQLSDLPRGWHAWRSSPETPWHREEME